MNQQRPLILIIEDEPQIRHFLRSTLLNHDYWLCEAATVRDGVAQATSRQPDIILLDLDLPNHDGLDMTRRLRGMLEAPIIVFSAHSQEDAKVAAFDAGADDYLTKPFGMNELLARIRVALRYMTRTVHRAREPLVVVGDVRVDLARRQVTVAGVEVHLTPIEYKLLTTLVEYMDQVVTHRELLEVTWGPDCAEKTQYLRVYIGHLRQKLEADPTHPRYLVTETGIGYRLRAE
jgi:two-component system KDP operon response regulator KdpE